MTHTGLITYRDIFKPLEPPLAQIRQYSVRGEQNKRIGLLNSNRRRLPQRQLRNRPVIRSHSRGREWCYAPLYVARGVVLRIEVPSSAFELGLSSAHPTQAACLAPLTRVRRPCCRTGDPQPLLEIPHEGLSALARRSSLAADLLCIKISSLPSVARHRSFKFAGIPGPEGHYNLLEGAAYHLHRCDAPLKSDETTRLQRVWNRLLGRSSSRAGTRVAAWCDGQTAFTTFGEVPNVDVKDGVHRASADPTHRLHFTALALTLKLVQSYTQKLPIVTWIHHTSSLYYLASESRAEPKPIEAWEGRLRLEIFEVQSHGLTGKQERKPRLMNMVMQLGG